MLLNETYTLKRGILLFGHNNGKTDKEAANDRGLLKQIDCIYIDPRHSDKLTDELKSYLWDNGALYSHYGNTMGWQIEPGTDVEELIRTKIKPAIIKMKEMCGENIDDSEIEKISSELKKAPKEVDLIIKNLEGINSVQAQEAIRKISYLKNELFQAIKEADSIKDIFTTLDPLLEYGRNFGYKYSLGNLIAMYAQDPEATIIKTASEWKAYNRTINEDAIIVWATTPAGERIFKGAQRKQAKEDYAQKFNTSYKQARVGIKNLADKYADTHEINSKWRMTPHYDIRFTKVIDGKSDIYTQEAVDTSYYDTEEIREEVKLYFNAVVALITNNHLEKVSDRLKYYIKNNKISTSALRDAIQEYSRKLLTLQYRRSDLSNIYDEVTANNSGEDGSILDKQVLVCTWIVMKKLGYNLDTTAMKLAYVWGPDESNYNRVFDMVAGVATVILNQISAKMQELMANKPFDYRGRMMNRFGQKREKSIPVKISNAELLANSLFESKIYKKLSKIEHVTGLDVAEAVGCSELYKQALMINESKNFYNIFNKLR